VTIAGVPDLPNHDSLVDHLIVRHAFQPGDAATITPQVAAGPWTTVISCRKTAGKVKIATNEGDVLFTVVPNPHHLTNPHALSKAMAIVGVSDHFGHGDPFSVERTILALDAAGRLVTIVRGALAPGDGKMYVQASVPHPILQRIAEFRLCVRPYRAVRFTNIAAVPKS
jgi:hypothetical protein